ALRRSRTTLAEQLGLDPGPALVDLEQAILSQRMELLHAATASDSDETHRPAKPSTVDIAAPQPGGDSAGGTVFVGRTAELAAIRTAATAARAGGGVVLVSGEAGSGKSCLLRRAG